MRTATHGCVEHRHTLGCETRVDSAYDSRRIRRQIEPGHARTHCREQFFADVFHFPRTRQRREHDIRRRGDSAWTIRPLRAGFEMGLCRVATQIVDGKLVSGLAHVERHRATHRAQAYESNFHRCSSLKAQALNRVKLSRKMQARSKATVLDP